MHPCRSLSTPTLILLLALWAVAPAQGQGSFRSWESLGQVQQWERESAALNAELSAVFRSADAGNQQFAQRLAALERRLAGPPMPRGAPEGTQRAAPTLDSLVALSAKPPEAAVPKEGAAKPAAAVEKVEEPSSRFTMQLQADSLLIGQSSENRASVGDAPDGSAFRRARFGWFGEYKLTEYRIEMDFALAGRPTFLDVWASWKDLPLLNRLKVGHYFEPFSLERLTSNRFLTFNERSLPDVFAPARNMGIASYHVAENQRATWTIGAFRTNSDVFGDDSGDQGERSVTTRASWLPWYDEPSGGRYYAHLGAAYSFRDADNDQVQFRSQPEARIGATIPNIPNFVDTGQLAAHYFQLLGLEAAWVSGPFLLQGEYMLVPVERIGGPDVEFQAAYLTASYFLTGEHRPYRRDLGFFDRVKPFEEAFCVGRGAVQCRGSGAWEVAARLSHLDLNDGNVAGGDLTNLTLALNWYLSPWTRVQLNYIHAFLDRAPVGESDADIVTLRVGFDF